MVFVVVISHPKGIVPKVKSVFVFWYQRWDPVSVTWKLSEHVEALQAKRVEENALVLGVSKSRNGAWCCFFCFWCQLQTWPNNFRIFEGFFSSFNDLCKFILWSVTWAQFFFFWLMHHLSVVKKTGTCESCVYGYARKKSIKKTVIAYSGFVMLM